MQETLDLCKILLTYVNSSFTYLIGMSLSLDAWHIVRRSNGKSL